MKNTRYLLKDLLNHLDKNHYVTIYKRDRRNIYELEKIYRGSPINYLNDPYSKEYFVDTICASWGEIVIYV